ncbi:MAG TPA: glycosyltransferase family 9 protein [Dongiaceae bacterium]|nr:glycosyltransferase family 9 protein [Dongiaceae bacterium]
MSLAAVPQAPPDSMIGDRLRAAVRAAWLAARTPPLFVGGLFRKRATLPASQLVSRILVVRTDRLGDMALSTAFLADLKAHFRHARVTVLAPPAPLALLDHQPNVDARVALEGRRLPDGLAGRFDLAIDLTPDERLLGARLAAASRAPWRIGFARAGRESWFSLACPPARSDRHLVDLHRDLLEALGVTARGSEPCLIVSPGERAAALARLGALGAAAPRVLVHAGAHEASQRWAPEKFAEVIARLTESVAAACLLAGGPGEEEIVRRIADLTADAIPLGSLSVRELIAVTGACDLFVGNNSGPLHVAAALGVPTLSVMGPTDPVRFAPRGPASIVMRLALACSPCQRGRCWHHTCLRGIDAPSVADRAVELLIRPEVKAA